MTFEEILDQALAILQRRRRVAYRTLQVQFNLDDNALKALKDELLYAQQVARDEDGRVWYGRVALRHCQPLHHAPPHTLLPLLSRRLPYHRQRLDLCPPPPLRLNAASSPCCFVTW